MAGSATATVVANWLSPVLIVLSVALLARSFYLLYVRRRGTCATVLITWAAAGFVAGYWTGRLMETAAFASSPLSPAGPGETQAPPPRGG